MITMAKLALSRVLNALDRKDRNFYKNLPDNEKKEIQPYVLMRYLSTSKGPQELREWYLRATNEYVNKGYWNIPSTKHQELLWLLLTTVSPNMGNQYHEWIPMKKGKKNKKLEVLEELFPEAGDMELETLDMVYDTKAVKQMLRDRGYDDKHIKSVL